MNDTYIQIMFAVYEKLLGFFCPSSKRHAEPQYFSLSAGLLPLSLAPSTSLGHVLTPLGLRGSQPVGTATRQPCCPGRDL